MALEDLHISPHMARVKGLDLRMGLLMTDYIHTTQVIADTQEATISRLRAELAAIRHTIQAECQGRYTRPFDRIRKALHPSPETIDAWAERLTP